MRSAEVLNSIYKAARFIDKAMSSWPLSSTERALLAYRESIVKERAIACYVALPNLDPASQQKPVGKPGMIMGVLARVRHLRPTG